jgi:hypothetical protein
MSKRQKVSNLFRPSDSPLTEYEKEQIALRKNLERLKAERLAREAAGTADPKSHERQVRSEHEVRKAGTRSDRD